MYVAVVPNRSSPPAVLLRESFRQGGKVHNRTLANLSHWSVEKIEGLRQVLKGDYQGLPAQESAFDITRSLPHGHVAAALGTVRHLQLDTILDPEPSRQRTSDNWPVQSFQDWLKDLSTVVRNRIQPRLRSLPAFQMTTRLTPSQQYALDLLGVRL